MRLCPLWRGATLFFAGYLQATAIPPMSPCSHRLHLEESSSPSVNHGSPISSPDPHQDAGIAVYSQYEKSMKGGLTEISVTTKLASGEKVTHRKPKAGQNPEEEAIAWNELQHQSDVLTAINPENNISYLPKNHGLVKFADRGKAYEMSYLEGKDMHDVLRDLLGDPQRTDAQKLTGTMDHVYQMAEVLNDLHTKGLVHNDVKSHNFILDPTANQTHIFDFAGSVYRPPHGAAMEPTALNITYLPPEVKTALDEHRFDFSMLNAGTDFYSFAKDLEATVLPKLDPGDPIGAVGSPTRQLWEKRKLAYDKIKDGLIAHLGAADPRDRPANPFELVEQIRNEIYQIEP